MMIVFRLVSILILSGLIYVIIESPKPLTSDDIYVLIIFVSFVCVLGPFWPTEERQEKIAALIRRYPKTSRLLGYSILLAGSIQMALDSGEHPDQRPRKLLGLIYDLSGALGIQVFWGLMAVFAFTKIISRK